MCFRNSKGISPNTFVRFRYSGIRKARDTKNEYARCKQVVGSSLLWQLVTQSDGKIAVDYRMWIWSHTWSIDNRHCNIADDLEWRLTRVSRSRYFSKAKNGAYKRQLP